MSLLANEQEAEELLGKSLRSRQVSYHPLREDSSRVGRLQMSGGESIDIRHDGHRQLLICGLSAEFEQALLGALYAGHGSHPAIDSSMRNELVFRLREGVYVGDTVWVQCYFQGKFFCAFGHPGLVMDVVIA